MDHRPRTRQRSSLDLASTTTVQRTSAASAVALLLLAAALTGRDSSTATTTSATSGARRVGASGCPKTRRDFTIHRPDEIASPARLGRLRCLDKAVAPGWRPIRFDITVTNPLRLHESGCSSGESWSRCRGLPIWWLHRNKPV